MRHDPYPAVRRMAFRSLRRLHDAPPPWTDFDPTATADERARRCDALAERTTVSSLDVALVTRARALAAQTPLWIGE
ncbi:MAG: hypothetical protein MUE69_12880 [Myxococcota bacterium]|nr:hypothetical protein [Myxococcota bacterium]